MNSENFIEKNLIGGEEMIKKIKIEDVLNPDESLAKKLSEIENASFNGYENESVLRKEDFIEYINNPENVVLVAKSGDSVVGYAIAVPFEDAIKDLSLYDPEIIKDEAKDKYYGESITVQEEYRKQNLAIEITREIVNRLKKRGVKIFAVHIRNRRGEHDSTTSSFLKNKKVLRTIPNWLGSGNNFDYVEYEI